MWAMDGRLQTSEIYKANSRAARGKLMEEMALISRKA